MKKLFASCPMNGATKEEIMKRIHVLHKLAEIYFGEELDLINTYIEDDPDIDCSYPKIWYIGKSLELLSKADCYVGVHLYGQELKNRYYGCEIENDVSKEMNIPRAMFNIHLIVPEKDKN